MIYNRDRFELDGDGWMTHEELLQYFYENYYPREEVMYRLPVSVSISEFWPDALAYRKQNAVVLPLKSWDGHPYWYAPTKKLLQAGDRFVEIARDESIAAMPQYEHDEGIIDEAYYSSVIEGAYSTRQRAREFIVSGAAPKDRSERMILNNYEALRFVLEHLDGPINEAVVLEIARILTDRTLDEGVKPGYRDDGVQVVSGRQEVVYVAPDHQYVKPMMDDLLRYIANPDVHPIIKACVTHIYFVTVHPLFDGNGRTARALAYMILLKAGYHFIRQFPISGILAQERSKCYKAIRASQSPENGYDFTYFLEYYAAMLEQSVEGIHEHMAKFKRVQQLAERLGNAKEYERILKGAHWMVSENIPTITTEKWRGKFKVSFETARQDLMKLEEEGFLTKRTVGRKNFFDVTLG